MNELEIMEMKIASIRRMYKSNLEKRLISLVKKLEFEIEELQKNPNYKPNGCGIIQGEATSIDELCVKLGVLDDVKQS